MKHYFLGLEWRFLPEGRADLEKRYAAKLRKNNLGGSIDWESSADTIWVKIPDKEESNSTDPDKSYSLFHESVLEIIEEETGDYTGAYGDDDDDAIESNKVARIKMDEGFTSKLQSAEFPQEVRFYKYKDVWKTPNGFDMRRILSRSDFEALKTLSHATLIMDLNQQRIFIGSHKEENVHCAIHKLNNNMKHIDDRTHLAESTHVFYGEDCESFQVNLQLFTIVGKNIEQTTVFPSAAYTRHPKISKSCTVRICPYDPKRGHYPTLKPGKLHALSNESEVGEKHETWKLFKYAAKDYTVDPVKYVEEEPTEPERASGEGGVLRMIEAPTHVEKHVGIKQWAAKLQTNFSVSPDITGAGSNAIQPVASTIQPQPLQEVSNRPKSPSLLGHQPESLTSTGFFGPGAAEPPLRPSIARPSTPDNLSNASSTSSYATAYQTPVQYKQAVTRGLSNPPHSTLTSPVHHARPTVVESAAPVDHNVLLAQNTPPANSGGILSIPMSNNPETVPDQVTQSKSKQIDNHRSNSREAPSLPLNIRKTAVGPLQLQATSNSTPHNPESSTAASKPSMSVGQKAPHFKPLSQVDVLLFDDIPSDFNLPVLQPAKPHTPTSSVSKTEGLKESIQENEESLSRKFHLTMRQRAPKPSKKTNKTQLPFPPGFRRRGWKVTYDEEPVIATEDPTQNFIQQFNNRLGDVLNVLRGYRGEVELKVEFGRHVIEGVKDPIQGCAEKPNTRCIQDMETYLTLPNYNKSGAKLPTLHFTPVLTTLPSDVRHLVQLEDDGQRIWSKIRGWKVAYFFTCHDAHNNNFFVKMDAENFNYEVRSVPETISVINVHCGKKLWNYRLHAVGTKPYPAGEDFAAELVKTLHIKKDLQLPSMSFETGLHHQVSVQEIHVRRTCYYDSTFTTLDVTEVQNLEIQFIDHSARQTRIVRARSRDDHTERLCQKPTWYEATISSKDMEKVLHENENLDFGEQTGWKTEDIFEKNVGTNLCAIACTVVKQIDGMGFYNDNGEKEKEAERQRHKERARRETATAVEGTTGSMQISPSRNDAMAGKPAFW